MTEIAERFERDTADHQMTVLHDDGLYRHLRFVRVTPNAKTGKPERSSFYWFDLVTWPGSLAINGDCGSFQFSRETDMFGFFRGQRINPQYWAEKVAAPTRDGLRRYSEDRFRQLVAEYLAADNLGYGPEADWPGLTEAALEGIFGDRSEWHTYTEDGARQALDEFEFGATYLATCICGAAQGDFASDEDARAWCRTHASGTTGTHVARAVTKFDGFTFTDTREWDLSDHHWQFIWCCHAIQWGIGLYDKQKVPVDA